MENEEMEVDASSQEEVESVEETTEEQPEESIEDLKARLAKAEEIANNQKIRAEKAEKAAKPAKEEKEDGLSSSDIIAITRSKVSDEDIEEVVEFAKFKGISISEALKDDRLNAILRVNEEKRNVAQATNVSTSKRGSSKISDDVLLENAKQGKLPDSPEALAEARFRMKKASK